MLEIRTESTTPIGLFAMGAIQREAIPSMLGIQQILIFVIA